MEYINEYLENGYIIGDVNQDFKITDELIEKIHQLIEEKQNKELIKQ